MDAIRIRGTRKLQGRIQISGAKNAALPICARRCSRTAKVRCATCRVCVTSKPRLLCCASWVATSRSAFPRSACTLDGRGVLAEAPTIWLRQMRASILVLGPARRALRPSQGLAARRLSNRRATGRSAPAGARSPGRQDLGRTRLHFGRSLALESSGGGVRYADRHGHREFDDGRRLGQGALDLRQLRA